MNSTTKGIPIMSTLHSLALIASMNLTIPTIASVVIGEAHAESQANELRMQAVVEVEGASKDELYSAALKWFGLTYNDAQSVLQVQDKASGTIVGKGAIRYEPAVFVGSEGTRGWIKYTISVEVKEGRFRYTVESFRHEGTKVIAGQMASFGLLTTDDRYPHGVVRGTEKWRDKVWDDIKTQTKAAIDPTVYGLLKHMKDSAAKKDDW
jgi:hypothetical protein